MIFKFDKSSLVSMSYLFSSSSLKKILETGNFSPIQYRVSKHAEAYKDYTYLSFVRSLYNSCIKNYKNEYFYKNTILNKLVIQKYSLNNTLVLDEFKIGSSIADLVLLNGKVRIYEIKTELDSLDKIQKQINDYKKFADEVYIVTSKKLLNGVKELYTGTNIGIIEYRNKSTLYTIQEAKEDKSFFDYETIFKTLRKNEYVNIIGGYYGRYFDVPNTQSFKVHLELAKKIRINDFQKIALNELKKRKLKCTDFIKTEVPMELRHMCYTLDLNKHQYLKLFDLLNTKIS